MTSFIGSFHVIFVHFPVALLTTSVLFYIFALFNKSSLSVFIKFYEIHRILLFLGLAFVLPTVITGLIHSWSWNPNMGLLWHKFSGLVLLCSTAGYWMFDKSNQYYLGYVLLIGILTIVTGHLGGVLTHG